MGEFAGSPVAPLKVEMFLDHESVRRGLKQVEKEVEQFDKQIAKAGKNMVKFGAIASAAIGALGTKFIFGARSAEDAQRKFNAVFRDEAANTRRWLQQLANDFALNRTQVESWLSRAQDLFVPMGLARDAAAELSQKVVELSTKVAVFNGMPTEHVLDGMIQGLIGVTRSVRRYGILINEARVNQKGLELGLVGANGKMSEQAKVLARLELMLDDSADAMGRAKSLMGGIRGDTTKVTTAMTELSEEIGMALAPALKDFTEVLVPAIQELREWVKIHGPLIASVTATLGKLALYSVGIGSVSLAVGKLTAAIRVLSTMKLASLGGIGAALGVGLGAFELGQSFQKADITEMEERAKRDIERTQQQLDQFFKWRRERWKREGAKLAQIDIKTYGRDRLKKILSDVMKEIGAFTNEKAQIFGEQFGATVATASRFQLEELRGLLDEMLATFGRSSDRPEFATAIIESIRQRIKEIRQMEITEQEETERAKAELRVTRFEEAIDTINDKVRDGLNKEVELVRNAIERISDIRLKAMEKVVQLQQNMLRRAISTEQAIWEIDRGDPSLSEKERWEKTHDRVKELIEDSKELALDGQDEVAKEQLANAASLARSLATGDEKNYAIRASLAKAFLEEIKKEQDALAEAEIAKQQEIIDEADKGLEKLGERQKELLELFSELGDELRELATEATNIKIDFNATGAFATIAELQKAISNLKGDLSGLDVTSGLAEEGVQPSIEEMQAIIESGQAG
jgi:hypothetical protein